jgi:hypothetical protein
MPTKPSRFASLAVTPRGYKAVLVTPAQPTSPSTISLYSSTSFPTSEKLIGRLSLFPFGSMVELSWPTPVVMQEHLQNLVSQGYMIAVELATCRVPADPASPTTVVGFIVVCLAF